MAYEPAELADDVAIVRVKNVFVPAIGRSVRGHDQKNAASLIDAFLDYQPTLWRLSLNQGIDPRR